MKDFNNTLLQMEGKRVYIDTNIFIYFFGREEKYFELVSQFLKECAHRKILGIASELVLAEILVKPYRERNLSTITQVKAFFGQKNFLHVCKHPDGSILEAAMLAGEGSMKLIDAMHFHTALSNQCDFFITHDENFKSTDSIKVVQIGEFLG